MKHWLFWLQPRSWRHRAFAREVARLRRNRKRLFVRELMAGRHDEIRRSAYTFSVLAERYGIRLGDVVQIGPPPIAPLPR